MMTLKMARYKKSFIIVVCAFVLIIGGSGYFNGFRLKKSLQHIVNPYLTSSLNIGSAYINAFTGNGYLKNVRIPNPPGFMGANALLIERIDIKGGPRSLRGEVITLDEIHFQNIELAVLQTNQGSNFVKLWNQSGRHSDYGLKEIHLQTFRLDPVKVFLGPKIMNQNPFQFTLQAIEAKESDLKDRRMRSLGQYIALQALDQIEALHQAGHIPTGQQMGPWVQEGIQKARMHLKKYQ
ncbi:MAG: hypothetical protein KDK51_11265 [Deltaproteobacteria bacterium]|nr:hypothetical protein [Deltaproteobacteria bacterium]